MDPAVFSGAVPSADRYVLFPNPVDLTPGSGAFNPRVYLGLSISGVQVEPASATEVLRPQVFDITGRSIGEFELDPQFSGGAWFWDATNKKGAFVAPGIYVVRAELADGEVIIRRVGVVR